MPSPRTMGMGLTLACADQEKIVCRLVSETISSAVMAPLVSVVVMRGSFTGPEYMSDRPSAGCADLGPGFFRRDSSFSVLHTNRPERWVSGLNQRFAKPS